MGADRQHIANWLAALADQLVADAIDGADLAKRLSTMPALAGDAFALEAMSIMRIVAESVTTPAGFDAMQMPSLEDAETRSACTVLLAFGLSIAAPSVEWLSRPQARAARRRLVSEGDLALAVIAARGAEAVELHSYISMLVEVAAIIVSDQAANAAPVVRVETGVSLPSTALAYHLYGDASRAQGLVEIAESATPMLMPVSFEALER